MRDDNRLYIWQVYDKPPIDGLLVSYHPLRSRAPKYLQEEIDNLGIHNALNYNETILGDCGAFSYMREDEPPYSTSDLLEYYDKCGFDVGATMDHLIIGDIERDAVNRRRRYDITLKNARLMMEEWAQKYQNGFELMGAAQGWNPQSYADAVETLIETGFMYIGLGGLAGASTQKIRVILNRVFNQNKSLGRKVKIHLFGVNPLRGGSDELLTLFNSLKVTSFDTSIMLRQAWRRVKENYMFNSKGFTAIRVPMKMDQEMSNDMLKTLRGYAEEKVDINSVLSELEKITQKDAQKWLKLYKKTLLERPWEKCPCKICKDVGIDVMIFRGNERNMRRGFHNVYQFYHRFIEKEPLTLLNF